MPSDLDLEPPECMWEPATFIRWYIKFMVMYVYMTAGVCVLDHLKRRLQALDRREAR
jgi:hypothetical protein